MRRIDKYRGMTLIECLVALAIASVIAIMLVSLLSYLTRLSQHRQDRLSDSQPMQELALLLDYDISSMFPKAIRWSDKSRSKVVDVGDQRWCWTSLVQPYQHGLQLRRVCYQLEDDVLSRLVWPAGDSAVRGEAQLTNQWRGIHSFLMRWPSIKKKSKASFWPHVWVWQVLTAEGEWNGAAYVRVWPKGRV